MRRPRLTIGRLMILVAVLGVVSGAFNLGRRSDHYRRQATLCIMTAELYRSEIDLIQIEASLSGPKPDHADRVRKLRERIAIAKRDSRRFQAAWRRPWQGVPDDPD